MKSTRVLPAIALFVMALVSYCASAVGAPVLILPPPPDNEADAIVRTTFGGLAGVGEAPEFSLFTVDILPPGGIHGSPVPPIAPGRYPGWCFDADTDITADPGAGTFYGGFLFSSLDPNLNSYLPNHNNVKVGAATWAKINWLINHRLDASLCGGSHPTMFEVQKAITAIFNQTLPSGGGLPSFRQDVVDCLVAAATAATVNGFTPNCGEKIAVIYDIDVNWDLNGAPDVQLLFIEVPLLCVNCPRACGFVDMAYSSSVGVVGGTSPYLFSVYSGSLPPGLSLNPNTGLISGVPTTPGTYPYTLKVTDSAHTHGIGFASCSITIYPQLTVNNAKICGGGSATLTASFGAGSVVWSTGETTPSIIVSPASSTDYTVTLTTPEGCTFTAIAHVDVGNGQIGDFVWNDLNANGCQDGNEPGIPDVTVNLYADCANPVLIASTTTDSNGKYLFTGLCAGDYTVSFQTPNGFTRTLANQACNINGKPSDETDSDCDCAPGQACGVCVHLANNNSTDLTIDCGYIGKTPCVTLVKTADSPTAANGAKMGYTYTINNCGGTPFTNVAIIDDAGTPNYAGDDFTVAKDITLNPGETKSYHVFVFLPVPLCAGTGTPPSSAGTLITQILPSGDIKVTFLQSRNLNDNVYGTPAPADGWGSHTFGNLTGSDKAEFRFTDGTGKVVLDFFSDYVTSTAVSPTFPAGYASLGPNGGDGSMVTGSAANVLFYTSTLAESLNHTPPFPSLYTVNSPTPEASFPTWDYVDGYIVIVSKNAFGAAGFGGVTIPNVHNSPAKTGNNQILPTPCGACIENIARLVTVNGDGVVTSVLASDDAVVCTGDPTPPTPPCILTKGTLKIDKNTIQLPIKNNGTSDVFLTELDLTWAQAINGKLKKVTLNGDVYVSLTGSPVALTSGFTADPNKRKIAKGQTKTLVLQFEKPASKVLSNYSGGTVKFGGDASCSITFLP